ncbi:MAG: tape measure protein, partial [Haloferacaceae archaeon]|nr:tape measure protein [Haloferacaceae archaeon]
MAEVGRIQIEVDARQVDKATRALNDLGLKAQATGRKVDGYEKQTKQATKATDKMANSSRKLTRMFGLLSAGIGGLTFVGLARSIERATTQLANIEATMRVAAGSSEAAGRQIAFIREESERLGLFFPTVAKQMAQFSAAARGTSIDSRELRTIFTGISEASRAMGLTAPEAEGAMKALQQMMSKGKVSAEELRQQLGERMPGSIQIMAASLDVGTQELFKMMEQGKLLSDEVLPKFGRELS